MNRTQALEILWLLLPQNKQGVTLEVSSSRITLLIRDGLLCDIGPLSCRADGFVVTDRTLLILTDRVSVPLEFLDAEDMQVEHER